MFGLIGRLYLGCVGVVQGALEQGCDHGKNGRCNDGNEGCLRQSVDSLLQTLCGGVLDGLDEKGYPGCDVVVLEESSEAVHRLDGLLGDL